MIKLLFSALLFVVSTTIVAQTAINQLDSNGKRQGVWKKVYHNGNKRYIGQFEHGEEVGTFKFYAITGEKHPIALKIYTKGSTTVAVRYYSLKGMLESEGQLIGKERIGTWT